MREFKSIPGYRLVRGYVAAVARFREQAAVGADSAREVYPPLFEALNWAHSLWDTWFRRGVRQEKRQQGLRDANLKIRSDGVSHRRAALVRYWGANAEQR
jgi:hypothetical protein